MRNAVGVFGLVCGCIVIGLVGRYGFKSTDVEADAWIVAFLYGAIATAGLFGHAVAVRLWRHNRAASLGMGIISFVALALNLSNALGAIAGRQDQTTLERVSKNREIRAAETELKRVAELRDAMPLFDPTDEPAVAAAKRAADTASSRRAAECGVDNKTRGRKCEDRERDDADAASKLASVTAAKAATDRAADLEARAQRERVKLGQLGPPVTINVQGAAIAKLFRLPDTEAEFMAMAQQFATAAVVELIILICMIGWEVMGSAPIVSAASTGSDDVSTKPENVDSAPARANSEPEPVKLAPPPRPQLVAASDAPPAGSIPKILTAALEPAQGQRVEMADIYRRYAEECGAEGRRAVTPEEFVDPLFHFCRGVGIKTKTDGDHVYLLGVRLSERGALHPKREVPAKAVTNPSSHSRATQPQRSTEYGHADF